VVLLVILVGAITMPFVQTLVAKEGLEQLNTKFGTKLYLESLAVDVFGNVTINGLTAVDTHGNDFVSSTQLKTSILDINSLIQGRVYLGPVTVDDLFLRIHKYKGEELTTLDQLIAAFDDGKPGQGKFRLKSKKVKVNNSHLIISDDNNEHPVAIDFKQINGEVENFFIKGPDIYGNVKQLSFKDNWGLNVKHFTGDFSHTKTSIGIKGLQLITDKSSLKGDLKFTYAEGDMKHFTDKVNWDFAIKTAALNTSDINPFADVFAPNKKVYVQGRINGVMNNFTMTNVNLVDGKEANIIGRFAFKNVFDKEKPFWMKANLTRLQARRESLVSLMPEILGGLLPEQIASLGLVNIQGDVELTKRTLSTDATVLTTLGKAIATIDIENLNDPNTAKYKGNIVLDKFNIGAFVHEPSIGIVSLDLDVDGVGFNQKSLNTSVKGDVYAFTFNKYTYKHIAVDGLMKMPFFQGIVIVDDPNLQLDFNGKIDLSSKIKNYDFKANVGYADLHALHLVNDTLSKFTGDFTFKASGNTLDDLVGEFKVNKSSYNNSKEHYIFDEFSLSSTFNASGERTINIYSNEAIEGYVKGKFSFVELKPLFTNALGSLYTNYSPYKIKPGQYMDFDISINNRLIEVFFPQLTLSKQTHITGIINNDDKEFKLDFSSPSVAVDNFAFYNILLNVNNANPLYNTYVSIDSVNTKGYKIKEFNLLNLTHNDTLFVRSEFKGGKDAKDNFNLNLYHTINNENLSVVGFKKSEILFKNFLWNINEKENSKNKIIFNKKLTDFEIDSIAISHNQQEVLLKGIVKDSVYKHLDLNFKAVDLAKITPDMDNLKFEGSIDGDVHFSQQKNIFKPNAKINVNGLKMNDVLLGDLAFNVEGDEKLKNFKVNSHILNMDEEKFYLNGEVGVVNKKMNMNLEAGFKDFLLKPIEPLLSSIVYNVRGFANGKISILGDLNKPEVNGRLNLSKAGMTSKFTGVDYNFEENSPLDLTERTFLLRKVKIIDSKYKTEGIVDGDISHKMFKDWALNVGLKSDNLLALDTKYTEGSLYYGTAFINGEAKIYGPVEMLSIDIKATSNKGTTIKIPLKEAQVGSGDNNFVHFLTPEEKRIRLQGGDNSPFKYKNSGIELDFEFVVTPDAEIEIILDRESGHAMKGKGAGFITMEINTLGRFNMWGDFQAYEGEYNYKYGGLIDKKFVVKKFGTIRWEGDPMSAILDLQALYHTEANPSVIVDNSVINRKVPTDVVIELNGSLSNPDINFDINFPTVSSVVRSEIEYKLSDRDIRMNQAMALLATGSFFSSDNSSSALAGSLFERASSIFDELFSDVDDKFKVGLNYAQGERNPYLQTEGRLGVTFSTKVTDRISVNGKLGVPVGGVEQSVIVGDVEVLLSLNEQGTLNARFFNRENDINYIGEGIGYTQGVGLSYELDFDTFKELFARILNREFKKQKRNKENSKEKDRTEELPDSDYNRDFIRFYENRRKSASEQTPQYNLTK
jgi:hypothetical protein